MVYSELTRRHFEQPRHAGDIAVGGICGAAGDRAQGTRVRFALEVSGGRIRAARFRAFGCPHVIAACDLICEQAEGEVLTPQLPQPPRVLCARLDAPMEKLGRLLVVEDAWVAAVRAVEEARR